MLTNLIENRGKEFSNLIKIGDYLARTLRENVEMFGVEEGVVTYLTESGNVISGQYSFKPFLKLSKIQVEDASVLEDKKIYESSVSDKISGLLYNLLEDDYPEAEGSFDKILSLFEAKMSYNRIKNRLQEKVDRFGEQTSIVTSKEFGRVEEMKDQLVEFLKENKEVTKSPALQNAMRLATLVSTSFDIPKLSLEQISESKEFVVATKGKVDLYEYLCRKELVQKEILEAKQCFENVWVDNPQVQELASMIFESEEENIRHQVAQTITEIPYFALATKKQISEIIKNSLTMNETTVKKSEINSFAGEIFKMKKPVKAFVIDTLNEKYGIDIKQLTDVPTFRSLAITESEIIRSISKETPEDSLLSKTLNELADILISKDGAETIDLADFLNEVFAEAECLDSLNEASLMDYMDFSRVAEDLGKIGQILKMLSPKLADLADESVADQTEDMEKNPDLGSDDPMDSGSEAMPTQDANDAAEEVKAEEEQPEEMDEQPEGDIKPEDTEDKKEEEVLDALNQLEDLLSGILKDDDEDKDKEVDPEQYKS
tara:strand:- start:185 stop:1819 length:1635 start_codon:yes stop_codon:yes gene_type:complete